VAGLDWTVVAMKTAFINDDRFPVDAEARGFAKGG
jgi:hypothetical protein